MRTEDGLRGWLALALVLGCSSTPAADAGPDAGLDVPPDVGLDVPPDRPRTIPPLLAMHKPQAFAVPSWMVATFYGNSSDDPVLQAVEAGEFTLPAEGTQFDVDWRTSTPGEHGELPMAGANEFLWAAAQVTVPAGSRLFARADFALEVYTNGVAQPGDVYGSRRFRLPLAVHEGTNLIVVRTYGGRGRAAVQLSSTPDELVTNPADLTTPDLVQGSMDTQFLGVPVLNLASVPAVDFTARVEDDATWQASALTLPSLAAGAVTQVAFQLVPRAAWGAAGQLVTVGLRLESPLLQWSYRTTVTLRTVAAGSTHRRSFRSSIDNSAQYYGVVPPSSFDPMRSYALVLSLHGAGVEGIGQAQAYSPKDWAYLVAPTNRRPFGFDWEGWGRRDGIEVLDHATQSFRIAPDQVYVTGHSMGGHGTWQLGTFFPGRFATLGPSAGWGSFYSYVRQPRPGGAFARSEASSDTQAYLSNLARRGIYAIHGTADDNVPYSEGSMMVTMARRYTMDVEFWSQMGAGHWWDGDASPGADCVDWPPLFEFMRRHRLDPTELDFTFTTPSSWVSATHSYVTILSETTAWQDAVLTGTHAGTAATLATTNVRTMRIDGRALRAKGITTLTVDGTMHEIPDGPLVIGPTTGKQPGVHGPVSEVFYRPFCFVYPDDGPAAYRHYAAYLVSDWAITGNGQACALPWSELTMAIRRDYNLIYLGLPVALLPAIAEAPIQWDDTGATIHGTRREGAAVMFVYPDHGRLAGYFAAPVGLERILFHIPPIAPALEFPDYYVWTDAGGVAAGFFGPDWSWMANP